MCLTRECHDPLPNARPEWTGTDVFSVPWKNRLPGDTKVSGKGKASKSTSRVQSDTLRGHAARFHRARMEMETLWSWIGHLDPDRNEERPCMQQQNTQTGKGGLKKHPP